MSLKIVKFEAENFKRLRAVEIEPDGNVIVVAGRNGAGKTSVLDAIWAALGGAAATKHTPEPVRQGEQSATVRLDMGELIVTRKWNAEKGTTTLKVQRHDGATYDSPQRILDTLVGKLCFDPLTFSRLPAKDQLAQLLELVELPFDVDELAAKRRGLFDSRTDVNRELHAAEARLAVMPVPAEDVPTEEVSATDVLAELNAARAEWDENNRKRAAALDYDRALVDADVELEAANDALLEAERRVKTARAEREIAKTMVDAAQEIIATIVDPDLDAFTARLAKLDETNAAVRAAAGRRTTAALAQDLAVRSDYLTGQLEQLDAGKAAALADATMPVEGLAFDEDGVTYRGVPLSQCSAAEQLRVSVAMAMSANPDVRVIRITDGSLLDSSSMEIITAMAADRDYQVWIEVVDESGEVGVVIEDGAIANAPAETVAGAA